MELTSQTCEKNSCSSDYSTGKESNDDKVFGDDKGQPAGVSTEVWEKFQQLKQRREELTKKTTYRRIKDLQKKVYKTVSEEFNKPDELTVLQKFDVKIPETKQKLKRKSQTETICTSAIPSTEEKWEEVKQLLTIHDHFQGVKHGRYGPKTQLEDQIDEAVAENNYELAEKLSDHLANREFGSKIETAIAARDFLKKKKDEEKNVKLKKKLNWGFEAKERWEMKGNL